MNRLGSVKTMGVPVHLGNIPKTRNYPEQKIQTHNMQLT